MHEVGSILVVITPRQPEQLALKRAKLIASITKSHLHLLVCDRDNKYGDLLAEIARELTDSGYSVSTEQAWNNSYHETIIQAQQEHSCGLVIKQHFPENPLKRALLTPDDWKLLRYCPCPVLIAKTNRPWSEGKILAAVDVGNTSAEHRQLHDSLIENAFSVAAVAKAQLHVFCAYPAPMLSAADPTFQLRETIEARYREQADEFAREHEIEADNMHLKEGDAETLLPYMASKLDAVVTIVGTVARTGLSGALIGNTAEAVVDNLETDVVVVKPQNVSLHLENLLRNA